MGKHGALIIIKNGGSVGHAFVDGIPDKCKHDDKGDIVYYTLSGKRVTWNTHKKWASMTTIAREPLIYAHYEAKEDPIQAVTTSCSKCGKESMSGAQWL